MYIAFVGALFCLLYPFLLYATHGSMKYRFFTLLRKLIAFLSSAFSGIFYRFTYEKKIDWSRTYIICANHTSMLDITALTMLVRSKAAFLGKEELLRTPVASFFFKRFDIPVRRESVLASYKAYKKASAYIKFGISVIMFPEGKIEDTFPPVLLPFKGGAFRLAIENKIPILPVVILNSWKYMWDDGSRQGSRPGICKVKVFTPVETASLTVGDESSLSETIHKLFETELLAKDAG